MAAVASTSASLPGSRSASPLVTGTPNRFSTPPPPPPAAAVPTDFKSSLSAWWNNSSYKEARLAEERLLRRMTMYAPPATPLAHKGWFGWNAQTYDQAMATARQAPGEEVVGPMPMGDGMVATLRNVFIPTPDPHEAPQHPADPRDPNAIPLAHKHHHGLLHRHKNCSASSSTASLPEKPAAATGGAATSSAAASASAASTAGSHEKLVDYINTLEITTPENAKSKEAVVVMHGYAAAFGFFFRNWESIATAGNKTGRRTFFLDWLGMGLSSRPSPHLLASASHAPVPSRVARAEHFFLSSLESWRISQGIEKMVLVGHSLGGYLASAYTVRYPERVSALVLVSPAGIPRGPEYKRYPLTADLKGVIGVNGGDKKSLREPGNDEAVEAAEEEIMGKPHEAKGEAKKWNEDRAQSTSRKYMMKFFVWGWERGISPFQFLRSMGPWAPMFAGRYASRRFAAQKEEDIRDLHSYIYNTSILRGSGEYCISHILAPGAYARIPIIDRITKVKVPITFIYGDNDWMDVDGGKDSVAELKNAGNEQASVHVVPKAGHHVYLDNPEETNRIIDEAIAAVPQTV